MGGKVLAKLVPLTVRLEETPPVMEPAPLVSEPLRVRVLAPMLRVAARKWAVALTVVLPERDLVALPERVRFR
jgi:hypothetical protein